MAIEKIKIVGPALELPAKQHCQFSPFGSFFEVLRILISSIAISADYSYEVRNSEIWAPAFFKHNNPFIAISYRVDSELILGENRSPLTASGSKSKHLSQILRNFISHHE